jgi:hypothetical protein
MVGEEDAEAPNGSTVLPKFPIGVSAGGVKRAANESHVDGAEGAGGLPRLREESNSMGVRPTDGRTVRRDH